MRICKLKVYLFYLISLCNVYANDPQIAIHDKINSALDKKTSMKTSNEEILSSTSSLAKLNIKNKSLTKRSTALTKNIEILMILWRGETDAERGFLQKLEKLGYNVSTTIVNADKNLRNLKKILTDSFKAKNYDYIYSFGTLASTLAIEWNKNETPLIANIINFPKKTGFIYKDQTSNSGNFSGICINPPFDIQINNIKNAKEVKNITVIIDPNEQNSQEIYDSFSKIANEQNVKVNRLDLITEVQIASELESFAKTKTNTDAIYMIPSTLFSDNKNTICEFCKKAKIPLFTDQKDILNAGAFSGTVADYKSAGKMAAHILNVNRTFEVKMKDIPFQLSNFTCLINKKTAEDLKIVPDNKKIKFEWIEIYNDKKSLNKIEKTSDNSDIEMNINKK